MLIKLIFTVIGIAVLWFAFRYVAQRAEIRGRESERRDLASLLRRDPKPSSTVDDTQQCSVCGDYIVIGRASHCGRANCPY